jgi:hypothetical protein
MSKYRSPLQRAYEAFPKYRYEGHDPEQQPGKWSIMAVNSTELKTDHYLFDTEDEMTLKLHRLWRRARRTGWPLTVHSANPWGKRGWYW